MLISRKINLLIITFLIYSFSTNYLIGESKQSNIAAKIIQGIEKNYHSELAVVDLNNSDSLLNIIMHKANSQYWFLALSRYQARRAKSIKKIDLLLQKNGIDSQLNIRLQAIKQNLHQINTCLKQSPDFIKQIKRHRLLLFISMTISIAALCIFTVPITLAILTSVLPISTTFSFFSISCYSSAVLLGINYPLAPTSCDIKAIFYPVFLSTAIAIIAPFAIWIISKEIKAINARLAI